MITFEQFKQLATECVCCAEATDNEDYEIKKGVMIQEWITGGERGNSCWGSNPEHFTCESVPTEFVALDDLLIVTAPTISLLSYRKMARELIKSYDRREREYYGNYTDYSSKTIDLEELYTWLEYRNLLSRSLEDCPQVAKHT